MSNICENDLTINGSKVEVAKFMANVVEVSEGGVEYNYIKDGETRILPFGWLQEKDNDSIVFDSKWETPVDNFIEISNLHPELTFTIKYMIPNDEIAGIIEIKNAEILRDEKDEWISTFARELFGNDFIDNIIEEYYDDEEEVA